MQQYSVNTSLGAINVNDYTTLTTNNQFGIATSGWQFYSTDNEIQSLKEGTKKEIKMAIGKNKRGLFQVILVDPKKKEMILNTLVIADTVEDVLLEVDAGKIIKEKELQVSEVDKIVNILGEIRKTRKSKDTGELEIIIEEETK